jgi:hypothetical protein
VLQAILRGSCQGSRITMGWMRGQELVLPSKLTAQQRQKQR